MKTKSKVLRTIVIVHKYEKKNVLCQDDTKTYVTSLRDVSHIIERKIKLAVRGHKISKSDILTVM